MEKEMNFGHEMVKNKFGECKIQLACLFICDEFWFRCAFMIFIRFVICDVLKCRRRRRCCSYFQSCSYLFDMAAMLAYSDMIYTYTTFLL